MLGSCRGKFSSTSIVKVEQLVLQDDGTYLQQVKLTEIDHYAKCSLKDPAGANVAFVWLAAGSFFFDDHQCKVWYGYPIEVWGGVSKSDIKYVLVSSTHRRVAFCKASVSFSRHIGTNKVIVVSPID